MSLILDALRKSESERRRGQAPGLFTPLPTAGAQWPPRRSPWPGLIALGIATLALLTWWLRPVPAPAMIAIVPPTPAPTTVTAPAMPAPIAVAKLAPTPPAAPPQRFYSESLELPPPPPPPSPDPAPEPMPINTLPTLASLDASERATLPPLKLSMHVWSEAPNARLAIIDGQRVMEGAALGESIVAEIRRDGVVLEWHGRRFLLPRP